MVDNHICKQHALKPSALWNMILDTQSVFSSEKHIYVWLRILQSSMSGRFRPRYYRSAMSLPPGWQIGNAVNHIIGRDALVQISSLKLSCSYQ